MSENINKIVDDLSVDMASFATEAVKYGNKAAARRARGLSLKIVKSLKEYRKHSVK